MADRLAVLGQLGQPAPLDPGLHLRGPRVAGEQHRRPGLRRPERQHVAGVRIGRPLLDQQVVAVVPQRDQTEVADRRVRGRPVADHHLDVAAPRGQEGPVAGGRAGVGDSTAKPAVPRTPRQAVRSRSRSRWSGTTITAPRPLSAQARAASARPAAQSPLGAALGVTCQQPRGPTAGAERGQETRSGRVPAQRSERRVVEQRGRRRPLRPARWPRVAAARPAGARRRRSRRSGRRPRGSARRSPAVSTGSDGDDLVQRRSGYPRARSR